MMDVVYMRFFTGDRTTFIAVMLRRIEMECTRIQIKSMKQLINGKAAPATFIVTVSVMSDLTLANGEYEDRHAPKALSIAENVWVFHNGRSVFAVLYW